MIKESTADVLPIWMLLSAAFGFIIGEAFGNVVRHRNCLQEHNDDLREELQKHHGGTETLHQALRHQRAVIHDIHKHLVAVTKGLRNRPS